MSSEHEERLVNTAWLTTADSIRFYSRSGSLLRCAFLRPSSEALPGYVNMYFEVVGLYVSSKKNIVTTSLRPTPYTGPTVTGNRIVSGKTAYFLNAPPIILTLPGMFACISWSCEEAVGFGVGSRCDTGEVSQRAKDVTVPPAVSCDCCL